jgi:hypothetical protein
MASIVSFTSLAVPASLVAGREAGTGTGVKVF